GHGGVCDPVALGALHTVHLHLGGAVDCHSQRPGARLACVHHKFTCRSWRQSRGGGGDYGDNRRFSVVLCNEGQCVTCGPSLQSCSVSRHHARVSGLARLSDPDLKRTAGDNCIYEKEQKERKVAHAISALLGPSTAILRPPAPASLVQMLNSAANNAGAKAPGPSSTDLVSPALSQGPDGKLERAPGTCAPLYFTHTVCTPVSVGTKRMQ
ncbi:hypothetical protein F7725_000169, partial [Dissostichus mawsoni]